jgi:hypothetical protein
MIALSSNWAKVLVAQPETDMGYQVATVFLSDGRHFDSVVIVGGTIASVNGDPNVCFEERDIDKIVVTHDKGR